MKIQFLNSDGRLPARLRVIGRQSKFGVVDFIPKIQCADGVTLSVQASRHHYCTPRADCEEYVTVEVGFPSVPPPMTWARYCVETTPRLERWWQRLYVRIRGYRLPTDTAYGYVPVQLVNEFIAQHGGAVGARDIVGDAA